MKIAHATLMPLFVQALLKSILWLDRRLGVREVVENVPTTTIYNTSIANVVERRSGK